MHTTLVRNTTLVGAACAALLLAGCESMSAREKGTAGGAAAGAAVGAVIGSASGRSAGGGAAIGGVLGAVAGNLWSKRMEDKREALAKASAGTGIDVERTADNRLRVNVPSDFSFDVGRADIKPAMRPVLDEMARNLDATVRIAVIGHTDDTGPASVNDPLSLQRAQAVRGYLAERGVSADRIDVQGRGEREPVASNASDSGRAANRRVEVFLAEQAG